MRPKQTIADMTVPEFSRRYGFASTTVRVHIKVNPDVWCYVSSGMARHGHRISITDPAALADVLWARLEGTSGRRIKSARYDGRRPNLTDEVVQVRLERASVGLHALGPRGVLECLIKFAAIAGTASVIGVVRRYEDNPGEQVRASGRSRRPSAVGHAPDAGGGSGKP